MIIVKNLNVEADLLNLILSLQINNSIFLKKENFLKIEVCKNFNFSQIIFFYNNDIPFNSYSVISYNIISQSIWH